MTGLELFIKIGIYTSAILLPFAILVLFGILFFKYGVGSIIQTIADKLDYIVDKITEDIKDLIKFFIDVIGEFIFKHANEIQMLVGGFYFYQHPPQGDKQYIAICVYFATNTLVLLRKGNINIEKIADSFFKKMSVDKKSTTEEHKEYEIK